MRGLRMMTVNPVAAQVASASGAIPQVVRVADVYEGLQKNMADGAIMPLAPVRSQKIHELAPYHTIVNMSFDCFFLGMNRSAFDGLPADLQKLFTDASGAVLSEAVGKALDEGAMNDSKWMVEQGNSFYALSTDEMKKFVDSSLSMRNDWVTKADGKGLPGKAVLAEAISLGQKLASDGKYIPQYPTTK
jgi:TRAP-type C4-dicarboxylate transport system substrate-binding protein